MQVIPAMSLVPAATWLDAHGRTLGQTYPREGGIHIREQGRARRALAVGDAGGEALHAARDRRAAIHQHDPSGFTDMDLPQFRFLEIAVDIKENGIDQRRPAPKSGGAFFGAGDIALERTRRGAERPCRAAGSERVGGARFCGGGGGVRRGRGRGRGELHARLGRGACLLNHLQIQRFFDGRLRQRRGCAGSFILRRSGDGVVVAGLHAFARFESFLITADFRCVQRGGGRRHGYRGGRAFKAAQRPTAGQPGGDRQSDKQKAIPGSPPGEDFRKGTHSH
jgi:hypothetical protein